MAMPRVCTSSQVAHGRRPPPTPEPESAAPLRAPLPGGRLLVVEEVDVRLADDARALHRLPQAVVAACADPVDELTGLDDGLERPIGAS
jgi:hypothetical protein